MIRRRPNREAKSRTPKGRAVCSRWVQWIVAVLIVPVIILALLELGLRVAGYGHSTRVFVRKDFGGGAFYVSNKAFYQQFFALPFESLVNWDDLEFQVPAVKPANTFRIFIFGGSAANGTPPDSAYAFWRVLHAMLNSRFPGVRFEVYNTASPGANSNVMRAAAKACAKLDPDLFVVYMGNNEFIGPFGAGSSVTSAYVSSLALIRAKILLSNLRMAQLAGGRQLRLRSAIVVEPDDIWEYLSKISPDDPKVSAVCAHFERNLMDIRALAAKAKAGVVFCTVGSNLRNWWPIASGHRAGLSKAEKEQFAHLLEAGCALEESGAYADAAESYANGLAIDDTYAEILFKLAHCHWELENYDKARDYYARARDRDFVMSRANTRLNTLIRQIADEGAGHAVFLADAAAALAAASPHGIPGRECFYDNVHPTFDGNYAIAKAVFTAAAQALATRLDLPDADGLDAPPQPECERMLAMTPWVLQSHVERVLAILPAFDDDRAAGLRENAAWLREREAQLREQTGSDDSRRSIDAYERALALNKDDRYLQTRYVQMLLGAGMADAALDRAQAFVSTSVPGRGLRRLLGAALNAAGEREAASAEFHALLDAYPDDAAACCELGSILAGTGNAAGALEYFDRTLSLNPGHRYAAYARGPLLEETGDTAGAIRAYQEAMGIDPAFNEAVEDLNRLLSEQGDMSARLAQWTHAVRAYPSMAQFHYLLGEALEDAGDTGGALAEFREAIGIDPGDPKAKPYLAMVLEADGDLDGAIKAYREIILDDPNPFQSYAKLDALCIKRGDMEARVSEWRAIAEAHPRAARAHFHLGMALEDGGDLEGAARAHGKAVVLNPDDPAMLAHLGQALAGTGDYHGAMPHLRAALKLNPGIHRVREDLVRALCETQQYAAAREEAERCRDMGIDLPPGLLERLDHGDG